MIYSYKFINIPFVSNKDIIKAASGRTSSFNFLVLNSSSNVTEPNKGANFNFLDAFTFLNSDSYTCIDLFFYKKSKFYTELSLFFSFFFFTFHILAMILNLIRNHLHLFLLRHHHRFPQYHYHHLHLANKT